MTDPAQLLEQTLHREIPISRALQIKVARYDGQTLALAAPLTPNINLHDTVFAGSLYSAAVLAGWGWLFLKLRQSQLSHRIVIHRSSIIYHAPVAQDFEAVCEGASAHDWQRFLNVLRGKGRGRLLLHSKIMAQDKIAVTFEGSYVVYS